MQGEPGFECFSEFSMMFGNSTPVKSLRIPRTRCFERHQVRVPSRARTPSTYHQTGATLRLAKG